MPDWLHRTHTGRVVYARRPHLFSSRDVIRVFKGWLWTSATNREVQQPEPAEILETVWGILKEAFLEIRRYLGPWILDVVVEILRRVLSALFNLISSEDAQKNWLIGKVLSEYGKAFMDTAIAYGATDTSSDGVAAIQDFIKEEL